MPVKHGAHHGLSYLLGIFLSVLLGELFRKILPGLFEFFDKFSSWIVAMLSLDIQAKTLSYFILGLFIVILYGVVIGIKEKKTSD